MSIEQHYKVLGLSLSAKKSDIKTAYRKLSMVYHPDRPTGNKDMFIKIKSAYEALMVPDTTKIHQQYQHRTSVYVHFNKAIINEQGDAFIELEFRNLLHIQGLNFHYFNTTFGYSGSHIIIKKKVLIQCGYRLALDFFFINGEHDAREFIFVDPRGTVEKFIDKLKSYLS